MLVFSYLFIYGSSAGDLGQGSSPGEENGNHSQYSCLENPMDRGTWWATVHGVPESDTTECTHTLRETVASGRRLYLPAHILIPKGGQVTKSCSGHSGGVLPQKSLLLGGLLAPQQCSP